MTMVAGIQTHMHGGHATKLGSKGLATLENSKIVTYDPKVLCSVGPLFQCQRNYRHVRTQKHPEDVPSSFVMLGSLMIGKPQWTLAS